MDKKGGKKKSTKEKVSLPSVDQKDGTNKTTHKESHNNGSTNPVKEKLKKVHKLQSKTEESIPTSLNDFSSSIEATYWPEEDVLTDKLPSVKTSVSLSRTSPLLQNYREFKAARKIQAVCRGWFVRHMLKKKKHAAMVIQRAWRGFCARRYYYRKLEDTVQKRIEEYFNHSARRIQAVWRGFWSRQNIHDQYRMMRMQLRASEDLLHCVAFKLHHLLRTRQIPGIYSLKNSTCLSKVEELLYAMQFKQFNNQVRLARRHRDHVIDEAKHIHKESAFTTEVPYAGPNFSQVCEPKCCELYKEADADNKMFRILSLYARATRDDSRLKGVRDRQKAQQKSKAPRKKKRSDFCSDVIESMKKWNILGTNKVTVNKDVFKCPENVEHFLNEIKSLTNILQSRCHCNINIKKLYAAAN